jgi:glycosyltransferase involved in cell wall biosynthesis
MLSSDLSREGEARYMPASDAAELTTRGVWDVTVTICSYNRCAMLRHALEGVLSQDVQDGLRYEVIVVDNNSTDATPQVVESFIARGYDNLRYVFEERQGVSFARNTAVAQARAPIVAFTDDDVQVPGNWVATLKRSLDSHPEVDWVGGKVLPRWPRRPPSWLTRDHWAPLAIVDYGDQDFYTDLGRPICLITASLAIRREAVARVGGFRPEVGGVGGVGSSVQRMKSFVGSMEDHELQVRLWKAHRRGLYDPQLVVTSDVSTDRLSKAYHRRWHFGHGHFYAVARLHEMEHSTSGRLFGVATHVYKRAVRDAVGWCASLARANFARALTYEGRLCFFAGFFARHYRDFVDHRGSHLAEVGRFGRSLMRRALPGRPVRSDLPQSQSERQDPSDPDRAASALPHG